MNEWLPIETAPRDGTRILGRFVFSSDLEYDGLYVTAYEHGMWMTCIAGIRFAPTGDLSDDRHPTHWMPLPAPPEASP